MLFVVGTLVRSRRQRYVVDRCEIGAESLLPNNTSSDQHVSSIIADGVIYIYLILTVYT